MLNVGAIFVWQAGTFIGSRCRAGDQQTIMAAMKKLLLSNGTKIQDI